MIEKIIVLTLLFALVVCIFLMIYVVKVEIRIDKKRRKAMSYDKRPIIEQLNEVYGNGNISGKK